MPEPTSFYVAIAYRWGYTNEHHYVVHVGNDLDTALQAAGDECIDRGGKYGVAVFEWPGFKLVRHFQSLYHEKEPRTDIRSELYDWVGYVACQAVESGKIFSPQGEGPGMKLKDVDVPDWLKEEYDRQLARIKAFYGLEEYVGKG